MLTDMSLLSLRVPGLLIAFLGYGVVFWVIDGMLARTGLYRSVWHPALLRVSLFVGLFSGAALLLGR